MKKTTLLCLALVTGVPAAEPLIIRNLAPVQNAKPDPLNVARMTVQTTIAARLQPSYPTFSRAAVMPVLPSYQVVERIGNEERLPFTISVPRSQSNVSGYVRLSDNAIFIFRPETKDYIPSTADPRFAPPKATEVPAVKPT